MSKPKFYDVYHWDNNITDIENVIKIYFRSLLVRELFIIVEEGDSLLI